MTMSGRRKTILICGGLVVLATLIAGRAIALQNGAMKAEIERLEAEAGSSAREVLRRANPHAGELDTSSFLPGNPVAADAEFRRLIAFSFAEPGAPELEVLQVEAREGDHPSRLRMQVFAVVESRYLAQILGRLEWREPMIVLDRIEVKMPGASHFGGAAASADATRLDIHLSAFKLN